MLSPSQIQNRASNNSMLTAPEPIRPVVHPRTLEFIEAESYSRVRSFGSSRSGLTTANSPPVSPGYAPTRSISDSTIRSSTQIVPTHFSLQYPPSAIRPTSTWSASTMVSSPTAASFKDKKFQNKEAWFADEVREYTEFGLCDVL
jgi:hypothetical protein